MKIILAGLGTTENDITLSALNASLVSRKVFVKTAITAPGKALISRINSALPLDDLFIKSRNYDTLNKKLADEILRASKTTEVVYYVDGDPKDDVSCNMILKRAKCVEVIPGISKASAYLNAVGIGGKYTAVSAYDLSALSDPTLPLVIYDIDSVYLASEVKLQLSNLFGDEMPCYKFFNGSYEKICIYEMDYGNRYDHTSAIVIDSVSLTEKKRFRFSDLVEIVEILRSENGCPWDKAQTKESIRINTIEEAYELVDAINHNDDAMILEEVGDVILQSVFQIIFAEERASFNRNDAISAICQKLISRHTHIFGVDSADSEKTALDVWDKNKKKEKGYANGGEYLEAVPSNLPALMRAEKVMNRAKKYNFEFENVEQIFDKILEEIEEVKAEIKSGYGQKLKAECGDLLCASTNLVRFLGVECEEALTLSTEKFIRRFKKLEQLVIADNKDMKSLSLSELDKYYNEAKKS